MPGSSSHTELAAEHPKHAGVRTMHGSTTAPRNSKEIFSKVNNGSNVLCEKMDFFFILNGEIPIGHFYREH